MVEVLGDLWIWIKGIFSGGEDRHVDDIEDESEEVSLRVGSRFWFLDIEKRGEHIEEIALLLADGEGKQKALVWEKNSEIDAGRFLQNHLHSTDILIGHNIEEFDIPELTKIYPPIRELAIIDTLHLSRFLFPLLPSHKLFDLLHTFRVKPEYYNNLVSHRALDDVRANSLVMSALADLVKRLDEPSLALLKAVLPEPSFSALTDFCEIKAEEVPAKHPDVDVYKRLWKLNSSNAVQSLKNRFSGKTVDEEIEGHLFRGGVAVLETNDLSEWVKLLSTALFSGRKGFVVFEDVRKYRALCDQVPELKWLVPWVSPRDECWCLQKIYRLAGQSRGNGWETLPYLGVVRSAPYPSGEQVRLFRKARFSDEEELIPIRQTIAQLSRPRELDCSNCDFKQFCGREVQSRMFFPFLASTPETLLSANLLENEPVNTVLWMGFHPLSNHLAEVPNLSLRYPDPLEDRDLELISGLSDLFKERLGHTSDGVVELELNLFRKNFNGPVTELLNRLGQKDHRFWSSLFETPFENEISGMVQIFLDPFFIKSRASYTNLSDWMSRFSNRCKSLVLCGMGLDTEGPRGMGLLAFLFGLDIPETNYLRRLKKKGELTLYGDDEFRPPGRLNPRGRMQDLLTWVAVNDQTKQVQILCRDETTRTSLSEALKRFYSHRAVLLTPEDRKNWPKKLEKIGGSSLILSRSRMDHHRLKGTDIWVERLGYLGPQSFPWTARINWLLEKAENEVQMLWITSLVPLKAALDLLHVDLTFPTGKCLNVHLLDPRWKYTEAIAGKILESCFNVVDQSRSDAGSRTDGKLPSEQALWIDEKFTGDKDDLDREEALGLLSRIWGYTGFKSYGSFDQWDVIKAVTKKQDFFMVVSTGGGKSVCFQVPAFYLQDDYPPPLTLVISPLKALMIDQVQNLKERGIFSATFINSSLSPVERRHRLMGIQHGLYSLLYLAPEQLRNPQTVKAILSRDLGFLAIDEAHTLSQWGHDFRTDFFYIKPFIKRKLLTGTKRLFPILAATATAKAPSDNEKKMASHTRADIIKQLGLNVEEGKNFRVGTTYREELVFKVVDLSHPEEESPEDTPWSEVDERKIRWLKGNLSSGRFGKKGIVYCAFATTTKQLAAELEGSPHVEVAHFNGQMNPEDQGETLDWFRRASSSEKVQVLVATNAFGMGIDIPDIGFVIHYDLPGTLEAYYQEAGRTCRDQEKVKNGHCILLYHPADLDKQHMLSRHNQFGYREISRFRDYLVDMGGKELVVPVEYIASRTGLNQQQIKQILFYLEYRSLLKRGEEVVPLVRFKGYKNRTFVFQIPSEGTDEDPYLADLRRHFSEKPLHNDGYRVELNELMELWNFTRLSDVENRLRKLRQKGMIKIKAQSWITFRKPWAECEKFLYERVQNMLKYLATKGARPGAKIKVTAKDLRTENFTVSDVSRLLRGMQVADPNWLDTYSIRVGSTDLRFRIKKYDQPTPAKLARAFRKMLSRYVPDQIKPGTKYALESLDMYHLHTQGFFDLVSILEEYGHVRTNLGSDFGGQSMELEVPTREVLRREHLDLEALNRKYSLDGGRLAVVRRYAEKVAAEAEEGQGEVAQRFIANYFEGREEVFQQIQAAHELDREQYKAIITSGPVHVEGTAGCGKSEIAVHKVHHLRTQAVPMDSIVVTAHSHNSMQNLQGRYRKVFGKGENFEVKTAHSLGLTVIYQCFDRLGFRRKPTLIWPEKELDWIVGELPPFCKRLTKDWINRLLSKHEREKDAGKTIEQMFARYWLDNFKGRDELGIALRLASKMPLSTFELWGGLMAKRPPYLNESEGLAEPQGWENLSRVREVLKGFVDDSWNDGDSGCVSSLCALCFRIWFENLLMEQNRITFPDQILLALRALKHIPELRYRMRASYDHAIVDEYQDLTNTQLMLLEELLGAANLTLLGDENQAIYSDDEHDTVRIQNLLFNERQPKLIPLQITYRSTTQIISMAHKLIKRDWKKLPTSKKGDGDPVEVWIPKKGIGNTFNDPSKIEMFQEIYRELRELSDSDPSGTVLITALKKYELQDFRRFLSQQEDLKVSTQVKLGSDPLKNGRYLGLRVWFRAMHRLDVESVLELFGFFVSPHLTSEDVFELRGILSNGEGVTKWKAAIEEHWDNHAQRKTMGRLLSELVEVAEIKGRVTVPWLLERLEKVADILGLYYRKDIIDKMFAINHPHYIADSLHNLNPDLGEITIADWLTMIFGGNGMPNPEESRPNLVIGNIHQIKGEEYSYVFVCGFRAPAEQKHLYVGITRAEKKAYLCFNDPKEAKKALELHRCQQGKDYLLRIIG